MKPGDIRMIFSNPIKLTGPQGLAKLIKKLSGEYKELEYWQVEFIDQPEHYYNVLINKT